MLLNMSILPLVDWHQMQVGTGVLTLDPWIDLHYWGGGGNGNGNGNGNGDRWGSRGGMNGDEWG